MQELKIPLQLKRKIDSLTEQLKGLYQDNLVSITLYGSAASGEFVDKHSNINMLIALNKVDLAELRKSCVAVNKYSFIRPLFLDQHYFESSIDVFPIEFLDMKENYLVLYGKDLLKDLVVDLKNLRFQCEQELKSKLIALSQSYVKFNNNKVMLKGLLIKTFTSCLHIGRNLLRLKGKAPPYRKYDVIKELSSVFGINIWVWEELLSLRQNQLKVNSGKIENLFGEFVLDLEKLIDITDKM
jgi:hypothetical protein